MTVKNMTVGDPLAKNKINICSKT